jgi:hypothetical protein
VNSCRVSFVDCGSTLNYLFRLLFMSPFIGSPQTVECDAAIPYIYARFENNNYDMI